jgi:4-amino-4-deoxy-L-arabinose transferase-like glycosyltransferase
MSDLHSQRESGAVLDPIAIRSLWIFTAAVVSLLLLARLVQVSMFFDGGIYASIARNLAEGRGGAWSLHFSETLFPVFDEHPPLMMWLLAAAFYAFGDSIAVEKCFSLLMFLISAALLFRIWLRLHPDDPSMRLAFPLALVLLLASGGVANSFINGMLENLVTPLSLAAVLAILAAHDSSASGKAGQRFFLMSVAGIAVSLSVLTKGPVGLFPLATPGIHWLVFRQASFKSVVVDSLLMLSVVALFFGALLSFDSSRGAIVRYLEGQLLSSLSGARGRSGGGLGVVRKILMANGLSLVTVALVTIAGWRLRAGLSNDGLQRLRLKRAVFLLVVGLSASLPIGLSPRVSNFYFNPSLFFFTPGFAVLIAPYLLTGLARLSQRHGQLLFAGSLSVLLGSIAIVAFNFGRPGTHERKLAQVYAIKSVVCPSKPDCNLTISACNEVWEDWALHTYLQRFFRISIAKAADSDATYMVANDSCRAVTGFRDTGINVSPYFLMQRLPGR